MLLPDKTTWRGASESAPTRAHLQHLLCAQGRVVTGSLLRTAPSRNEQQIPLYPVRVHSTKFHYVLHLWPRLLAVERGLLAML